MGKKWGCISEPELLKSFNELKVEPSNYVRFKRNWARALHPHYKQFENDYFLGAVYQALKKVSYMDFKFGGGA